METERFFKPSERYEYDFGTCSCKNGFAQIDTSQDAHYFGSWANPDTLTIVGYCEGDVTIQKAETLLEFVEEIKSMKQWNNESGFSFAIDPGLGDTMKQRFVDIGLGDLLH